MRAISLFLVVLWVMSPGPICAAGRTPFGGTVVVYARGAPLSFLPAQLATPAEACLQRALFEPLYELDAQGEPIPVVAAALPVVKGTRITIPLRADIPRHDASTLTAADVKVGLTRLLSPGSRAAHTLHFVQGARDHLTDGLATVAIAVGEDGRSLVIDAAYSYPEVARLLASPRALIDPSGSGEGGTGPWRVRARASRGNVVLEAFSAHPSGRPFLDAIEFRPLASRFGSISIARRGAAGVAFGVPELKSTDEKSLVELPLPQERPTSSEYIILAVGPRSPLRRETTMEAVSRALSRARLARKHLGSHAEPAERFLSITAPPVAGPGSRADATVTLLVAREAPVSHRFIERVQLDLLEAGVSATIQRVAASELEARRQRGDYELLVDSIFPDPPGTNRPIDRFHALLSVAAAVGRLPDLDQGRLQAFIAAAEAERERMLPEIESDVRRAAGLILIARRPSTISVRKDLRGLVQSPAGPLRLDGAYLSAPEGP